MIAWALYANRRCRHWHLWGRPALSEQRLSLTSQGLVRYTLKTPYRDGTTHVIMSPLEFLQRLAALVPRPRLHLIRFHGVLAPNSALRPQIVPATAEHATVPADDPTDEPTRSAQSRLKWAQLLKRVFEIDMTACPNCGGPLTHARCNRRPPGHSEDPLPFGSAHPGSTPRASQGRPALSAGLSRPDAQLDPLPSRSTPSQRSPLPLTRRQPTVLSPCLRESSCPHSCARVGKALLTGCAPHFRAPGCCDRHPPPLRYFDDPTKIAFEIPIPSACS